MEAIVGDALPRNTTQCGGRDQAPERIGLTRTHIIDEYDENVGGILRKVPGFYAFTIDRLFEGMSGNGL